MTRKVVSIGYGSIYLCFKILFESKFISPSCCKPQKTYSGLSEYYSVLTMNLTRLGRLPPRTRIYSLFYSTGFSSLFWKVHYSLESFRVRSLVDLVQIYIFVFKSRLQLYRYLVHFAPQCIYLFNDFIV